MSAIPDSWEDDLVQNQPTTVVAKGEWPNQQLVDYGQLLRMVFKPETCVRKGCNRPRRVGGRVAKLVKGDLTLTCSKACSLLAGETMEGPACQICRNPYTREACNGKCVQTFQPLTIQRW